MKLARGIGGNGVQGGDHLEVFESGEGFKTAPSRGQIRHAAFTSTGSFRRSKPQIVAVPPLARSMPVSIRSVVVLPAPLGLRN